MHVPGYINVFVTVPVIVLLVLKTERCSPFVPPRRSASRLQSMSPSHIHSCGRCALNSNCTPKKLQLRMSFSQLCILQRSCPRCEMSSTSLRLSDKLALVVHLQNVSIQSSTKADLLTPVTMAVLPPLVYRVHLGFLL